MTRGSSYRMFVDGKEVTDYTITEAGPGTLRMNLKLPEDGNPNLIGSDITLKRSYFWFSFRGIKIESDRNSSSFRSTLCRY